MYPSNWLSMCFVSFWPLRTHRQMRMWSRLSPPIKARAASVAWHRARSAAALALLTIFGQQISQRKNQGRMIRHW